MSQHESRPDPGRLATASWCATLVTLPWIGADLITLTTGRDIGAGVQPAWLLMGVTWLASVWNGQSSRAVPGVWRHAPQAWRRTGLLAAVAVLASAAGLLVARADVGLVAGFTRYMKQVIQLLIMISFLLWPMIYLRGDVLWRRTARWLVVGALLQVGYGALQQLSHPEPLPALAALERVFTSNPAILSGSSLLYVGDRFMDVPRLRGTACEPLYLGNYLLLAIPCVGLTAWSRGAKGVAASLLGLLLLLTWSRGAWLGAVGAAGVAAWWLWPQRPRGHARLAIAVVAVALLIAFAWEPARLPLRRLAQSFSTHDWSNLTRLYSLQAAWRAFLLSPVVGVGWGQFGWHFPALVDPAGLQAMFTWPVVANFPMLVFCETGLPGLAALGLGAFGLVRGVAACRAAVSGRATDLRVALAAVAAAGIAIQYQTFSQYNLPHAWVATGLLAAALLEARSGSVS